MFNIFPYVFQTTFNTLMNSDFIDNIIDSVLNNETVNNMINEIENMVSLDINLSEREKEYIISGRLPGVRKSDIDVDYNNNYVTIKVKRNKFFSNGQNFAVAIIGPEEEEVLCGKC